MTDKLPDFEGSSVREMQVKIIKTGDGLSEPLKVNPDPSAIHDESYYIVRCKTRNIDHRPITPASSDFRRIETKVCMEIVGVDGDDVQAYLDQSREAIATARAEAEEAEKAEQAAEEKAAREAAGILALPGTDPEVDTPPAPENIAEPVPAGVGG